MYKDFGYILSYFCELVLLISITRTTATLVR